MDVSSTYGRSMEVGTGFRISATDVGAAVDSPFSLYCKFHADESKRDPPDPFLEALSVRGVEHEATTIQSLYPEAERVRYEVPEDGFGAALRAMADGVKALSNPPLFYLPYGMYGYPDILERRNGRSVFGGYHYAVREIKVAKRVRKSHVLQAAFYARMMSGIQRRPPDPFRITNGEGATIECAYSECEDMLLEGIELAGRICGGWMPPAIYGGGAAPWTTHCNDTAIRNDDVSLIPGVGAAKRASMAEAGFYTVRDVASSPAAKLERVRGVGAKTATNYSAAARAIRAGECVPKGDPPELPDRSTEIFLDLEGLNDVFDDSLTDYLIGCLVRKGGTEAYHSFVAEEKREDAMLESFLDFMARQSDYAIYHWHHYERTHLRSMMERHHVSGHDILAPDTMYDLAKIATTSYAFPTYTNSIKDIAKWMGFEWRHDNVGATSSIELYLNYTKDPEAGRDGMDLVLDYNEDDCVATRIVKDWLAARHPANPRNSP